MICIGWDLFDRNIFVKDTEQWAYPSTAILKDKTRKNLTGRRDPKKKAKA